MPKKHPAEKVQQFLELRDQGVPIVEIARQIEIPYWTIQDWHQRKTRPELTMMARGKDGSVLQRD